RAASPDGLADLLLGIPVDVGRIEKRDAEVDGAPNQRHRRVVISHAAGVGVRDAKAHTAEAKCRDAWSRRSQLPLLHSPDVSMGAVRDELIQPRCARHPTAREMASQPSRRFMAKVAGSPPSRLTPLPAVAATRLPPSPLRRLCSRA